MFQVTWLSVQSRVMRCALYVRLVLEAQVRHEFFPLREGIGQIVGKKERSGSGRSPGIRAPERSGRHPIVEKMARIRRQSTTARGRDERSPSVSVRSTGHGGSS